MIISEHDAQTILGTDDGDAILAMVLPHVCKAVKSYLRWDPEYGSHTLYYPKAEVGGAGVIFPETPSDDIGAFGGQTSELILDHKYVLTTSLQVWEYTGAYFGQYHAFVADDLLVSGTDYALQLDQYPYSAAGILLRLTGSWPRSAGSVKVTYTSGFTAAELAGESGEGVNIDASDIRLATIYAVVQAYNELKAHVKSSTKAAVGVITGEEIPGYSYTVDATSAKALCGMTSRLPVKACALLQPYRRYSIL